MKPRSAPLAVYALGVVCIVIGAVLRFRAAALGAAALAGGPGKMMEGMMDPDKGSYSEMMSQAQYSNAMYDVSVPLLWTGGLLLVVAAIAHLFLPFWLAHQRLSAASDSQRLEHPVPGDLP